MMCTSFLYFQCALNFVIMKCGILGEFYLKGIFDERV